MSFFHRLSAFLGACGLREEPGEGLGSGASGDLISCRQALARVHEYLDGELDPASHADVARHFSSCQGCHPHLRLEERFRTALRRFGGAEVCPQHLKEQIHTSLMAEDGEPG